MKLKTSLTLAFCTTVLGLLQAQSPSTFNGNGNTTWGGVIGNGHITLSDDGANLTVTLNSSGALGGNDLVLYIDSASGGFSSTSGFNDAGDGGRSAVSGYSGSGQGVLTFASGFAPEYAIDFGNTFASLFGLANGGNNSLNWITGTGQSGASPYTLTVSLANLGLTPGAGQSIQVFGTLVSESGYRSMEAAAGTLTGSEGWVPTTQTSFSTYITTAVPEPTTLGLGISGVGMLYFLRRRR